MKSFEHSFSDLFKLTWLPQLSRGSSLGDLNLNQDGHGLTGHLQIDKAKSHPNKAPRLVDRSSPK